MTKSAGNLMLIRESLEEAMMMSSSSAAAGQSTNSACAGANILADVGLTNSLPPTLALRIIRQRIDLDLATG
jgi:hypothetical protein